MIENAWEFSREELKAWAYGGSKDIPDQDWELAVASAGYDSLVLEIAEDINCPNRKFMLVCLYMMVGDLIHCELPPTRERELIKLATRGLASMEASVVVWATKSINIIKEPDGFEYEEWCWLPESCV
jgi:hypothetical protein